MNILTRIGKNLRENLVVDDPFEYRAKPLELSDADIRRALEMPPPEHAEAQDAQFETLLTTATREDLVHIIRNLRRRLAGAEFAARTNHDTIVAMRKRGSRG